MKKFRRLFLSTLIFTLACWPALADRSRLKLQRQDSPQQIGRAFNAASVSKTGTESLGAPGISIAQGTALVGDGVGLYSQPGMLTVNVPAGSTVEQVLLYWNVFHGSGGTDSTALVNAIPVAGTLIGGETRFFGTTYSTTYRADITGLSQVSDGPSANVLMIGGLTPTGLPPANVLANGASVIAILDDGSATPAELQLRDGQDLAFINFAPPLDTTVAQTFSFVASTAPRVAELTVVAGSVQGPVSTLGNFRPNLFEITIDGSIPDDRLNLFFSNAGDEWDHHVLQVNVPAGATSITVRALSADPLGTGVKPASLAWLVAALNLPPVTNCELDVMKTCTVREAPRTGSDCNGKVVSMKLEYTGKGCDATTNDQGGKVTCEGGATLADDPADILVTDNRGDRVYADETGVAVGGVIEVLAANANEDKLENETVIAIGDGIETVKIHTSCSQPLRVGDEFGSVRLTELTSTNGGTVVLDDPLPSDHCTIPTPPPPPHCDGDISVLSLRYLGGDCDETTNEQEGKLECSGDAGSVDPVRIVGRKGGDIFLDSGDPASVSLGDMVAVDAANDDKDKLPSEVIVEIFDEFGNLLQDLEIHTSCSKDLDLRDRFGAVEVVGLDFKDEAAVSIGATVDYSYTITNDSDLAVTDVVVFDNKLGEIPGSPIDSIAADGGTAELTASAFISETTRNVVTVSATLADGEECADVRDSARVVVEEPPPAPQVCDSKVTAMLLEYTGPALAGPVTVTVVASSFRNDPVSYEFPGGLAPGTELSSLTENGFTIDSSVHDEDDLGSKTKIFIDGEETVLHTSCSTPFVAGQPAPLDDPKGDPSPDWFVVRFVDRD